MEFPQSSPTSNAEPVADQSTNPGNVSFEDKDNKYEITYSAEVGTGAIPTHGAMGGVINNNLEVVPQEGGEHHSVLHPPEPEVVPEMVVGRLETAPGKEGPRKVLRSWYDLIRRNSSKIIMALAATGAMGAHNTAEAGGIRGLEQALTAIAIGEANNAFPRSPIAGTIDSNGKFGVVLKTPDQMAVGRPASFEPGVREYAASIGADVLDQNTIFIITNRNNPADNVSITKYTNQSNYNTGISLRRAQGGGLLLSTTMVKNGGPQSQVAVIRIDQTGKFQVTVMGGN